MSRPRIAVPLALAAVVLSALPGLASARMSLIYDEQPAVRALTDPAGPGAPIGADRGAFRQDPGAGGIFDPAGRDAAHRVAKLAAGELEGLSPEAMADRIQDEIDDPEIANTSGLVAIDEIGNRWNDGKAKITYKLVTVRGKRIRVASNNRIVVTRHRLEAREGAGGPAAGLAVEPRGEAVAGDADPRRRPYAGGGATPSASTSTSPPPSPPRSRRGAARTATSAPTASPTGRPGAGSCRRSPARRRLDRDVPPLAGRRADLDDRARVAHRPGDVRRLLGTLRRGDERLHMMLAGTPAPARSTGCGEAMACQWALAAATPAGAAMLPERTRGLPARRAGHGLAQRVQRAPSGARRSRRVDSSPAGVSRWAVAAPGRRVAARPITELQLREDTGSRRRPDVLLPPTEPEQQRRRLRDDRAALIVGALTVAWAGLFSWLSVQRYRGFSTGRFDLGNMVQAVWSTAHGHFLDTTDVTGIQFNRLGAHVDPVLALFAPLWMVWSSPEMLLVAQAVIVSAGSAPGLLARAPLARRRPPGGGRRGHLPDGRRA